MGPATANRVPVSQSAEEKVEVGWVVANKKQSRRFLGFGSFSALIAVGYILISSAWIVLSGAVLHNLMHGPEVPWRIELIKGLVFVVVSGYILFLLYRREEAKLSAALQTSESSLRRLLESGVFGVCFCNENGAITAANDTMLNMLGYSRADLDSGQLNWNEITPLENAALDGEAMHQLKTKGVAATYEKEFIRKDGTRIAVLTGAAITEGFKGRIISYALDISLKRSQERRAELEEQLRHSQKLNAVGQLAAGMAHDFRNLLQIIIGYAGLIQAKLTPRDPLVEYAEELLKAAEKASGIIKKLLAFSQRQELKPEVVNLNAALSEMESLLRQAVGEKIDLVFKSCENLGSVEVDKGQIEQVLMNLVINALDAMAHGGRLTIETNNLELDKEGASAIGIRAGSYVVLEVADTGVGMSPEVESRIFEPFFTTKQVGTGIGLGLATVYGIVHQSGGTVSVRSKIGEGTRFTIYFPRSDEVQRRNSAG